MKTDMQLHIEFTQLCQKYGMSIKEMGLCAGLAMKKHAPEKIPPYNPRMKAQGMDVVKRWAIANPDRIVEARLAHE